MIEDRRRFFCLVVMNGSEGKVMNCDALAMLCVVEDAFVNSTITCHASCQTDAGEAYGQVIYYREGFTYDVTPTHDLVFNVTLVNDVNEEDYFRLYLERIQGE